MTVQELIDKLMEVKDKSKGVNITEEWDSYTSDHDIYMVEAYDDKSCICHNIDRVEEYGDSICIWPE